MEEIYKIYKVYTMSKIITTKENISKMAIEKKGAFDEVVQKDYAIGEIGAMSFRGPEYMMFIFNAFMTPNSPGKYYNSEGHEITAASYVKHVKKLTDLTDIEQEMVMIQLRAYRQAPQKLHELQNTLQMEALENQVFPVKPKTIFTGK